MQKMARGSGIGGSSFTSGQGHIGFGDLCCRLHQIERIGAQDREQRGMATRPCKVRYPIPFDRAEATLRALRKLIKRTISIPFRPV